MSDKAQKTVRIKWIRSAIGFTHHQKRIVRSLGLRKLNQEVERPDTPQIRGIVAKIPHLVKIVEAPRTPAWKLVPEYTIHAPAVAPAKPAETAHRPAEAGSERIEAPISPPLAPLPGGTGESSEGMRADTTAAPAESESGGGSRPAPTSADADAAGAGSAGDEPSAKGAQS